VETESEWLEFAEKHSREELKGEVADALSEKRKRPRKNGRGIPTLKTKVALRFTPQERALYRLALQKAGEEYGRGLGGERMTPEQTILILMQRMLETDPSGTPKGRKERDDPIYTILYHNCNLCNDTYLVSGRERVKVPPETLERVEGEAQKVEIKPDEVRPPPEESPEPRKAPATVPSEERDHKNTPILVKKVLLRDGQCCVNPFCKRRLGLQAHHIVFRCQGGKTILCNECALCRLCRIRHNAHTTAVQLIQAGVDRSTVALWLGHEGVETTQMYIDADLSIKDAALARTDPLRLEPHRYQPDDRLLAFLTNL